MSYVKHTVSTELRRYLCNDIITMILSYIPEYNDDSDDECPDDYIYLEKSIWNKFHYSK